MLISKEKKMKYRYTTGWTRQQTTLTKFEKYRKRNDISSL